MNDNSILAIIVAFILVSGSFDQFLMNSVFAEDLNENNEDPGSSNDEKTEKQ